MKSMEEMIAAAQKAAETIQSQMGEAQAKLDALEVEGQSGGGLVKVRATARGRILGVSIDDSLMKPEEKHMVEDLVTAAFKERGTRRIASRMWKWPRSRAGLVCRRASTSPVCERHGPGQHAQSRSSTSIYLPTLHGRGAVPIFTPNDGGRINAGRNTE